MTIPTDNDFSGRELSIDELDAVAGGSVWGWIKHEAGAVVDAVGRAYGALTEAVVAGLGGGGTINIKITHKQN